MGLPAMSKQRGRGGMGSRKHGVSGRAGPSSAVKRFTAQFFNKETERRTKHKSKMYSSVRDALNREKPK